MRKLAFLWACLFLVGVGLVNAQSKSISGKVLSTDDGQPIIGATVMVKGTTVGTITNADGEFKISLQGNAKNLLISYVGMKTVDVEAKNNIVINLQPDALVMDEIVVTALGISREKKSLGYSVQEVSGDAVNQVKSDNFMTSLSGKVSGIQIKNNTNFGGSTNVIIRGSSSLTGNNQALFVVDGIPIDNSNTNNSGELTGRSGYDYGNSASDIDPNNIESISVLKGAAATALYGSRASTGVVLITTKKGKANGKNTPNVRISSNVTTSTIDKSTFPTYQQDYGAGYAMTGYSSSADGSQYPGLEHYADVNGDGTLDYTTPYYEDASRGQKFDKNILVYQWDAYDPASPNYGKATPWVASGAKGPISLFETGISTSNNVDISGGDKNTTYRFSYTNFSQTGIMPNSFLNKNNAVFNGSHNITDNLKITTSATYTNTAGKGRPSTGYNDNIMTSFRQWSETNVDYTMQKLMYEKTGTNATWNRVAWDDGTAAYWDNPYFLRYENYETDNRSRLIGFAQLDWTITSDLKAMARYSIDTYNQLQEEHRAVGTVPGEFGVGRPLVSSGYARYTRLFTETNMDFMLNYHKSITDQIDLSAMVGSNIRRTKSESVYESTNGGLAVPNVYALSNSVAAMLPPEQTFTQVGVNGYFGSATLSYDDTYFLDATVRRDESSTLPLANRVYWYPSVTGSFLFSNLLKLDWMSLGKLRLNYAEVGGSAPALSVKDTYIANAPFSGNSLVTVPNTKLNSDLRPERQKALEGGLEMKMFKNRLGFDLAFYKNNTIDQLMPVSISYATGYASKWVNAGEIQNEGVELSVSGTPIQTKDFSWDINVNFASNRNKVVSLFVDEAGNAVTNLQIASLQGGVSINAKVGQPYGAILGSDYIYTNGQKTVNAANGRYLKTATNDQVLGNVNPDWTGGISNTFRYKNLALSFLVDVSHGGSIFSLDMWYGTGTGLYQETAGLNDLGNQKRDPIAWKNTADHTQGYAANSGGVIESGVLPDGTPNTVRRNQQNYAAIGWYADPNARFVYDASYIKLREVTLTYNFAKELYSKLSLTNASIGIVGSNLWIIQKNLPYADPEASQSSGNIQGWQSGVMPATRNVGVTLNLQF